MTPQPDRSAQSQPYSLSRFWSALRQGNDVGRVQFPLQPGLDGLGRIPPVARPVPFSPLPDARVMSGVALAAAMIIAIIAGVSMPTTCQVPQLSLNFGSDAAVSVPVPAAKACAVPVAVGAATVKALKIDSQPAHGQLLPRGRSAVVYVPKSGFKGEDAFAFSIVGNSSSGSGAAVFHVTANVQ